MEFIGSGVLELACASLQEITVKFSGIFQAGHKKLTTYVRYNDNRFIRKRVSILGCNSICQIIVQLQPYVGYRYKSLAKVNKIIL